MVCRPYYIYISPVPVVPGIGNIFNSSIYDTMLELNNLPYLPPPNFLDEAGSGSQRAQV